MNQGQPAILIAHSDCSGRMSWHYYYDTIFADKSNFIVEDFGYPVGIPNGKGYYISRKFWGRLNNLNHLGEDWRGIRDGNAGFGDTIYAIASGYVSFSYDYHSLWGKVVNIVHKVENKQSVFSDTTIVHDTCKTEFGKFRYIESLYSHCNDLLVEKGQWVKKGTPVATIGTGEGRFHPHLHLELRPYAGAEIIDGGYSKVPFGFINPDEFRKAYNERK